MALVANDHPASGSGALAERQTVTLSSLPFQVWFKAAFGFAMLALALSGAVSSTLGYNVNSIVGVLIVIAGAVVGGVLVNFLASSAARRR
jgi:hypothetical protein